MHERIIEILKANNLHGEEWRPEGRDDGFSYSAGGADGTIYVDFHSEDRGVIFSHHYGHQSEWDWESVEFNESDDLVCEEIQGWF